MSRAPARYQMRGAEKRRLKRANSSPQGEAIECKEADDTLMVNQEIHTHY